MFLMLFAIHVPSNVWVLILSVTHMCETNKFVDFPYCNLNDGNHIFNNIW